MKALQYVVVLCVLTFVESESQEGTSTVKTKPYKRTTSISTYGKLNIHTVLKEFN